VTLTGSSLALMAHCATGIAQSSPQPEAAWDVTLGAGAMYHPDYEGSDDYEVDALPLLAINYRDFIKLRGPALSVDFLGLSHSQLAENLSVGALVKFDMGREADDNPVLRQLNEIDKGAEAGLFAEYQLGPVTFEMTAVHDLGTRHEGTLAELKIGYRRMLTARLHGQLGVMATWADDNYTQSYFGISATEAQASGLRPFAAKGGVKDAGVGASLNYIINENWRVTGLLAYRRLLGDAADSPLVADEGSPNQASAAILVGYAF
jgi:outer membrane scaffolding protein for murein synthesis (MipA/OmpV family)